MKNTFKKLLGVATIAASLLFVSQQANAGGSFTFTMNGLTTTNLAWYTTLPGAMKITQIQVTGAGTTNSMLYFYDAPTNLINYTNAAYTNYTSYVTNFWYKYTNFFGVTTYITNTYLIDQSNSVAATAYQYPLLTSVATASNAVNLLTPLSLYVNNGGIMVTNATSSTPIISVWWTQ